MGRKAIADSKKKPRISVTIDKELLAWVDNKVNKGAYASRSECVEAGLKKLKK